MFVILCRNFAGFGVPMNKVRLVEDWKSAWRWFSVQAMALSAALTAAWQFVPDDLKSSLPAWVPPAMGIAILALGIAGRIVEQPKKVASL